MLLVAVVLSSPPVPLLLQDSDTQVQYWKVLLCDERHYPPGSWTPSPREEVRWIISQRHAWLEAGMVQTSQAAPLLLCLHMCVHCRSINAAVRCLLLQAGHAAGMQWHPSWPKFRNLAVR